MPPWFVNTAPTSRGMDGQDLNRRGYNDPPYSNQQPIFDAPQSTRGNSFGDLPVNRLSQQPPITAHNAARPNPSSLQQPFGYSYYQPSSSTVGTNIPNQNNYDSYNNYTAGPSRHQQIDRNYYVPYSAAASSYQTASPLLSNNSTFDHNQYSQRQVAPMPMGYNSNALFNLEDALPDPHLQLQQPLPPLPSEPPRQPASYAGSPMAPPNPPNPQAALSAQPIVNRCPFENGLDRVYAALAPIAAIIARHGDLNQARTMLLRLSEEFLQSVEQMRQSTHNS